MRIVYREAPAKFHVLRTVDHTHPLYAPLNREYEAWQADYLAKYKAGYRVRVLKSSTGPAVSPVENAKRDAETRKRFYMR
jgi:hypothetical protein